MKDVSLWRDTVEVLSQVLTTGVAEISKMVEVVSGTATETVYASYIGGGGGGKGRGKREGRGEGRGERREREREIW